jgi:hypothetical protein
MMNRICILRFDERECCRSVAAMTAAAVMLRSGHE